MDDDAKGKFKILSEIRDVEIIARRRSIRIFRHLCRKFGYGNWRKLKGTAIVELGDASVWRVELHWFEAHGIGKRDMKIKRKLERL